MSLSFARIPTTAQLRSLESAWIKSCHPSWGLVLMEAAAMNAAEVALSMIEATGGTIAVFCGTGNNGGDGLVVARHLARRNVPVQVFAIAPHKQPSPDSESSVNRKILESTGVEISVFDSKSAKDVANSLAACGLIIDALLGTGFDRAVEGDYAAAIDVINNSGIPVLAIDIPSGINSDTGQIMGTAVQAETTVTFGYLKAGLLHYPGAAHAGPLTLVDIGLPRLDELPPALQQLEDQLGEPSWWLSTHELVEALLPPREENSHKGTFGRLLSVSGSVGMIGAAMLSSRSALRTGLGLAVLATCQSVVPTLPAEEVIYTSLPQTAKGTLGLEAFKQIEEEADKADALLIGPGLKHEEETIKLVEQILSKCDKPAIVDADGLNCIALNKGIKLANGENVVFTPHPMELARLLDTSVKDIQSDRIGAAERAVQHFGCNIILKGSHTVVATTDGETFINPTGNAGMATAGSGDVLSGVVGALLAQGVPASEAAVAAAYIHGAAGDVAAATLGEDGMVASDIMNNLPTVMAEFRKGTWPGTALEREVLDL